MKSIALCVTVSLVLSGCAGTSARVSAYSDPAFAAGSIKSVAVFPIRNARLAPGDAQIINRTLAQAISQRSPSVHLVAASDAMQAINNANLTSEWAAFLDAFTSSGIADSGKLRDIGKAVGADAVLQCEIVDIEQEDGQYGRNVAKTTVRQRCAIFDVANGKLLWDVMGTGESHTATTLSDAPPTTEAIQAALAKMLANLPAF